MSKSRKSSSYCRPAAQTENENLEIGDQRLEINH